MNYKILICTVLIILLSGCTQPLQVENLESGAQLITKASDSNQIPNIKYEIEEGETVESYFDSRMRPALDWINDNTPEDALFLCWWDYGHMIRGYTGRKAVIYTPSENILYTLASGKWDEEASGTFSDSQDTQNVAKALTATLPQEAISIMQSYDATYILVTEQSRSTTKLILEIADKDPASYYEEWTPTEEANALITFKILDHQQLEGLEEVYSDSFATIYKTT